MVQRRNKNSAPCNIYWKNYDKNVLLQHIEKVGCRAPYQLIDKNFSICSTKEKMLEVQLPLSLETQKKYSQPCKGMEKIYYSYEEMDLVGSWKETGTFGPGFGMAITHSDLRYKRITQSRYD